jgi:hypothetical protein
MNFFGGAGISWKAFDAGVLIHFLLVTIGLLPPSMR